MHEINYREDINATKVCKEAYLREIMHIIECREQAAISLRNNYSRDIFDNQDKYREDFKAMLGWPLTDKQIRTVPEAKINKLAEEYNCSIFRVSLEIMNGLSIRGLLFQKDEKRKPLVIAQHGGGDTPELLGNLYGDTGNYNHMIERVLNYDVNVFAPQLLLWGQSYQVVYDRAVLDAHLKRVGSSITALEIYGIIRILDYFEAQDYVSNFGMIGLSYGGFYTLFTAAIDKRIKSALSCAFFSNRKNYVFSDWAWFGSAEKFSDAEIACLIYPRRLCIEVGTEEKLFDINSAREEISRLREMTNRVSESWLDVVEFQGGHEFSKEEKPIKRFIEELS